MSDAESSPEKSAKKLIAFVLALPTAIVIIEMAYILTGHAPGQFFTDIQNLFGIGHHCPAGQHWSSVLKQCFPN